MVWWATSECVFGFDDGVQRRWLDRFGQKMSDSTEPEKLDAEGHLVQRRAEDLRSHVGLQSTEWVNHRVIGTGIFLKKKKKNTEHKS